MDEMVKEIAEKHRIDPRLMRELVAYEQTKVHLERRRGAKDELRRLIEQHVEGRGQ